MPSNTQDSIRQLVAERLVPIQLNPKFRKVATEIANEARCDQLLKTTSDEIREGFAFFLEQELSEKSELPLSAELFRALEPHIQSIIQWGEFDRIRRDIKMVAFSLTQKRLRMIIRASDDTETVAFHLRQIIEVTWWALHCSYGAEVARGLFKKHVLENPSGEKYRYIQSSDLEGFLRGWFAPGEERVESGRRAINSEVRYDHPTDFVDENRVLTAKLRKTSEFWVGQVDTAKNWKLTEEAKCIYSAYEYLCGWVHVTPMLICKELDAPEEADVVPLNELVRAVVSSVYKLQSALLFDDMWNNLSYAVMVIQSLEPKAEKGFNLSVDLLRDLRHKNKHVEVELEGGGKVSIVPK